jgi:hypothetical protein
MLPDDGPLEVYINRSPQLVRVVDDLGRCVSQEFGQVVAATEGVEPPLRESR